MTDTVIVDNNTITVVDDTKLQTIVTSTSEPTVIVTGIMGPPGKDASTSMSNMPDVDITTLEPGSILSYDTDTGKWKATTTLTQITVECGQF